MTLPEQGELERTLCQLKGVEAARVCLEDGEISEIHVASVPGSRAKNVVRDVRSYLAAALGIDVHHHKISVAVRQAPPESVPDIAGETGGGANEPQVAGSPRVLFRSVNLLVEGLRSEVQVALEADGRSLMGSATGPPSFLGTERLVVVATLDAVEKMIRNEVRLVPGDLTFVRVGPEEAVIAEVVLMRARWEQRLIGACHVGQDRYRSVVFAVLDALNRILGRLEPGRWVEFYVEPASAGTATRSE